MTTQGKSTMYCLSQRPEQPRRPSRDSIYPHNTAPGGTVLPRTQRGEPLLHTPCCRLVFPPSSIPCPGPNPARPAPAHLLPTQASSVTSRCPCVLGLMYFPPPSRSLPVSCFCSLAESRLLEPCLLPRMKDGFLNLSLSVFLSSPLISGCLWTTTPPPHAWHHTAG